MRLDFDLKALAPWVAAFGIGPDARIATPDGDRPAASLGVGDLVTTRDNGPQPLTHVRQTIGVPAERNHYPIRIPQGALGFGLPRADLEIGPQHRVLFEHIRVPLMFGTDAVLVRAKSLTVSHDRVTTENRASPACYVQLGLARQDVILAEGLPIESVRDDGECDLDYMTVRAWELCAAVA
ncbi:MAG: Hint domain-containing protein [Pseudomonadota bacterium]